MEKRIMAIHDLCGFGRCSLSVIMPVLSVMGLECCALPTAYLSAPTNARGFTFLDISGELPVVLAHWQAMGLTFDTIYSGYLASPAQTELVLTAHALFPSARLLVDPVMGDHGQLYRRMDSAMTEAMQRLCLRGDIITPNSTEAALLLGKPPDSKPENEDEAMEWLSALAPEGRSVVLTGLVFPHNMESIYTAWHDAAGRRMGIAKERFAGREYHGSGDLFGAVLTGSLSRGDSLERAVTRAMTFVHDCAAHTFARQSPPGNGLLFEPLLHRLADR